MNGTVPTPPLEDILELAAGTAKRAGGLLLEGHGRPKSINYKGDIDLVTEFDLASEHLIVEAIKNQYPGHAILAEEAGQNGPDSPHRWIIDPLDGTTNFAHGFPAFCVSIAFEGPEPSGPEVLVGAVYDPLRDELFTAVKNRGAFLNGRAIEVSRQPDLGKALLATGFPYNIRNKSEAILARFRDMLLTAQGVRRAGSAALDLSWTAAGRIDGYWEQELHAWDTAAGALLVQEAGGTVTSFSNETFSPHFKEILATNGLLHYNMRNVLSAARPDNS